MSLLWPPSRLTAGNIKDPRLTDCVLRDEEEEDCYCLDLRSGLTGDILTDVTAFAAGVSMGVYCIMYILTRNPYSA